MVAPATRQQRRAAAALAAAALIPALVSGAPVDTPTTTTTAVAAPTATATTPDLDANVRFATEEQHAAVVSCNAIYGANMLGLNQKCVIRSNSGNLWCTNSKTATIGNSQFFYDPACFWGAEDSAKCSVM
ncbi:hypothetical protein CXG81DRAFT_24877 [Caulochytrium protostelioides]|uniref:Uncharacterized protein n=1 Tax=Caulochytrium protostelioides TaxID=1555241 RepID=A0A4P9XAU4_9FUNG|nr:hypothetical protein CXG81DRAFT_24877 [Caulochytrium protostelioides]|eukprot:RKP02504.1 hypothetical protein CXG81DRAFT_24877 [Caulochytrium protostelioides]